MVTDASVDCRSGVERTETMDSSSKFGTKVENGLVRLAAWIDNRNLAFVVTYIGMIVMLLWAGAFKMTRAGAEGIAPLVTNSPLIWWHYKIFGPYVGGDLIGITEWICAVLLIVGFFKPRAGIAGGLIGVVIFFTTSTMILTTPGAIISVPGIHDMRYMSNLGLFLFKDVISLGASLYLAGYFGRKATALAGRS
jgi:uncharacterized membrane protein YkgB